jgi:tRNAHis guanylyltransferase
MCGQAARIRCLKARETEDIPLVKLIPMVLEIGHHDLTNRVSHGHVYGKAFHQWTRGLSRPYDDCLHMLFDDTTKFLVEASDAVVGYAPANEITLILSNVASRNRRSSSMVASQS